MKKILKGLTVLIICGALNFGLTTDAQAAESDSSPNLEMSKTESQELSRHRYGPPPPPPPPHYGPPRHRHWEDMPPPPHYGPPPRHGYGPPGHRPTHPMPPPPPHRW